MLEITTGSQTRLAFSEACDERSHHPRRRIECEQEQGSGTVNG